MLPPPPSRRAATSTRRLIADNASFYRVRTKSPGQSAPRAKKYAKTAPHRCLGKTERRARRFLLFPRSHFVLKLTPASIRPLVFVPPTVTIFIKAVTNFERLLPCEVIGKLMESCLSIRRLFLNYYFVIYITLRRKFYSPAVFNVMLDYK